MPASLSILTFLWNRAVLGTTAYSISTFRGAGPEKTYEWGLTEVEDYFHSLARLPLRIALCLARNAATFVFIQMSSLQ